MVDGCPDCAADGLCPLHSSLMRPLVVLLRRAVVEEEAARRAKRDVYREARALKLPVEELRRLAGADVTHSGPASAPSRKKNKEDK